LVKCSLLVTLNFAFTGSWFRYSAIKFVRYFAISYLFLQLYKFLSPLLELA
jgi:hypothetical protein